ncbi:MAG: hypothetical protein DME13_08150 [Candidatus Rokuibacteriota bacterium]|nr:MAG: hypothetical protein DME13_08150 [Candidatus Rokubacteria bacterium]
MGGRRSREPSALHPPCSVARKVRHAEIAALAPHDRPGADVASGADRVRVLRRAGLRRIRFHDLRHTYASLLIAQGAHPKYIQAQLGHASIQTTLDRYGHLMPDAHAAEARKLDRLVFGERGQGGIDGAAGAVQR